MVEIITNFYLIMQLGDIFVPLCRFHAKMKDLRHILAYFCVASVLLIIIPLFLLDKFWFSQPYEAAGTTICWYLITCYLTFITSCMISSSSTKAGTSKFNFSWKSSYPVRYQLYLMNKYKHLSLYHISGRWVLLFR